MQVRPTTQAADQLLRIKDVTQITGMSRASVYRAMNEKRFPQSVKISEHSVGWFLSDVNGWLESLRNNNTQNTPAH